MASSKLTARPVVPVLVHAAMLDSLAAMPLGCGDDDGTSDSANSTDVAPTAGPCVHADGSQLPECQTTGQVDDDGGTTTTMEMTSTSPPTTTDQAPTAGPCVHADGSQLPECQTGSGSAGDDTGSGSDSGGTGSSSDSGSSSG